MADRVDRMRQGQSKTMASVPGKKVQKPADEAMLTFQCGHQRAVSRVIQHRCQACQEQGIAQQKQARLAAIAAKQQEQPRSRLPDKSTFCLTYDADQVVWSGTLIIDPTGAATVFEAQASSVFAVLRELDRLYRESTNVPLPVASVTQNGNQQEGAP